MFDFFVVLFVLCLADVFFVEFALDLFAFDLGFTAAVLLDFVLLEGFVIILA